MLNHKVKSVSESMDEYHANKAIGASKLGLVLESPAHYKHFVIDGNSDDEEDTPSMKFGRIFHLAALETEFFQERFVIEKEFKGKGSYAAYDEWAASLPVGTIILKPKDHIKISGMITSMFSPQYPDVKKFLETKTGLKEHSFYFDDPVTGLPCKFRPDLLTDDGWIVDIKTAVNSRNENFMKVAGPKKKGGLNYHISAAFYSWGYEMLFGVKPLGYIFLVIEKKPPYNPCLHIANSTVLEPGEIDFRKALNRIKRCMDENFWPGYQENGPENLSLPDYMLKDYEEVAP